MRLKQLLGPHKESQDKNLVTMCLKEWKKKTVNLFCLYFLSFCVVGDFCFFCFAKPDDPAEITVPFSLQYLFKSRNLDMSTVIVSRPMILHLRNRKWIVFM